ncbi:MAG: ISAs1 family transposase [Holosporales bacterium]|nr:ISAs1 family transposase [Holosporales bacterium]
MSSLKLNANKLNEVARAYWGIENKLHWRLDVSFNEDKTCIRNDNAADNMAVLRTWALTILDKAKDKKDRSVRSLMRRDAMSLHHLIKCVNTISHA